MPGKRKYALNEDYFKKWSEAMAYILGFIVADGNVSKDKFYLNIRLHPKDRDVLEFIKIELGSEHTIKISNHKKYTGIGYCFEMKIHSKIMYHDLISLGVVPKKTGHEIMPHGIPEEFIPHFIRGVFDGDGTVGSYRKGGIQSKVVSANQEFLHQMRGSCGEIGHIYKDGSVFTWTMGKFDTLKFRDIIYDRWEYSSFCLRRKMDIMFSVEAWDSSNNSLHLRSSLVSSHGQGRKVWTDSEESYIKSNFDPSDRKGSLKEIAIELGRSYISVEKKSQLINGKSNKSRFWTDAEEKYLRGHFSEKDAYQSSKQIASHLGRPTGRVLNKATQIGLHRPSPRKAKGGGKV